MAYACDVAQYHLVHSKLAKMKGREIFLQFKNYEERVSFHRSLEQCTICYKIMVDGDLKFNLLKWNHLLNVKNYMVKWDR